MNTTAPGDNVRAGAMEVCHNAVLEDGALRPVMPPRVLWGSPSEGQATIDSDERVLLIHDVGAADGTRYIISIVRRSPTETLEPAQTQSGSGSLAGGTDVVFQPYEQLCFRKITKYDTVDSEHTELLLRPLGDIRDVKALGLLLCISTRSEGMVYLRYVGATKDNAYDYIGAAPPQVEIQFGLQREAMAQYASQNLIEYNDGDVVMQVHESYYSSTPEGRAKINDLAITPVNKAIRINSEAGLFSMPFLACYAWRMADGTHLLASPLVLMMPSPYAPQGYFQNRQEDIHSYANVHAYKLMTRMSIGGADGQGSLKLWEGLVDGIDLFVSPQFYTLNTSEPVLSLTQPYTSKSLSEQYIESPLSTGSPYYIGTYKEKDGDFCDHHISTDKLKELDSERVSNHADQPWYYQPNRNLEKEICECSEFYRIAHISYEELQEAAASTSTPEFKDVTLDDPDLTNLRSRPSLKSHDSTQTLSPTRMFPYNGRMLMCDCEIRPEASMPIGCCAPANGGTGTPDIILTATNSGVTTRAVTKAGAFGVDFTALRWLYMPGNGAKRVTIGEKEYPLRPHPILPGAYWFGGFGSKPKPTTTPQQSEVKTQPYYLKPNNVFVSAPYAPWQISDYGAVAVGNGTVLGLGVATQAISQGQFGQYPVYAFTTDGVWALSVGSTGEITACHPVTRDVCINPDSIRSIDSAVVFATSRGLMMLRGAGTTNLSEAVYDINRRGAGSRSLTLDILRQACVLYDYSRGRIILSADTEDKSWMLSLNSGGWSTCDTVYRNSVESYPDAMAVTTDGYLVNASESNRWTTDVAVELVTRPLAFGSDSYKAVRGFALRGAIEGGPASIDTQLRASNNLRAWGTVARIKGGGIRGIRGSGYRYFSISVTTRMKAADWLRGISAEWLPKYNDKLH